MPEINAMVLELIYFSHFMGNPLCWNTFIYNLRNDRINKTKQYEWWCIVIIKYIFWLSINAAAKFCLWLKKLILVGRADLECYSKSYSTYLFISLRSSFVIIQWIESTRYNNIFTEIPIVQIDSARFWCFTIKLLNKHKNAIESS